MYFSAVMDFAPVKLSMDVFLVGLRVCECVGGHDSPCLLQLSLPPHSKVLRADLPVGEFRCYLFFFFFYFGGIIARMRNAFFFFWIQKSENHPCTSFPIPASLSLLGSVCCVPITGLRSLNWKSTLTSELEVDLDF